MPNAANIQTMSILSLIYILPYISYASAKHCQPFHTTFPKSSVSNDGSSPFIAISPPGSYNTGDGLELYLEKPKGEIRTKNGVNDKVAEGATINSTFTLLYGKVTYEVSAPEVAGVVTAVILIGDNKRDEIDTEILGGDPTHWQTNIFVPTRRNSSPMYGVFSSVESVPKGSIAEVHKYGIQWDEERIIWSIDGKVVRTLNREGTTKNGELHYPSYPVRLQLGIWDASNPVGTSAWAKGPINWKTAPEKIVARVRSVSVEC